jgi:hypothetical protein
MIGELYCTPFVPFLSKIKVKSSMLYFVSGKTGKMALTFTQKKYCFLARTHI